MNNTMNTNNNQGTTIVHITRDMLGKTYTDLEGKTRTLDKRTVLESGTCYLVTNRWGKSKVVTKGQLEQLLNN
jgi:hypothetical protein